MFEELPTELRCSFVPEGAIYVPGRVVPTEVRGYGHIVFLLEPTDRPEVLSVRLRGVYWRFVPFVVPIDIDGDGRLECVEITNLEVNTAFFDLEASRGTLNLETGEFAFDWEYDIGVKALPLMEGLGASRWRWTKHDRGYMDLDEGKFEMHCGVMTVDEGPLAGARFRGGGGGTIGEEGGPPPSTVSLKVMITVPGADCERQGTEHVWICPGDQVTLCWTVSSDVTKIRLQPGNINLSASAGSGTYVTTPAEPAPSAPPQIVYSVETVDGNTPGKQDTVIVEFYRGGRVGPFQADPDGFKWTVNVHPASYSGRIEVHEIQLLQNGCLDWKNFFLEHTPAPPPAGPGGGPDYNNSISGFNPISIPQAVRFRAAGTWNFYADPDPPKSNPKPQKDEADPVCFIVTRGVCRER
jgi:hypothetical protein